jgi:hypothetical protein
VRGTGTPKDRDEVNHSRREVLGVCDLESIVTPSIFNVIRSVAALERMFPTLDLSCEANASRR